MFRKERKKSVNYQLEQYRGYLKQIMHIRNIRSINLSNYNEFKKKLGEPVVDLGVHSVKIDLMNDYIHCFAPNVSVKDKRAGDKINDVPVSTYKQVYDTVQEIIGREKEIPYSVRRNILVNVAR